MSDLFKKNEQEKSGFYQKVVLGLPESQRKIILWVSFILIAFLALSFWAIRAQRKLQNFQGRTIFQEAKPDFTETEDFQTEIEELKQDLQELNQIKEIIGEEITEEEIIED